MHWFHGDAITSTDRDELAEQAAQLGIADFDTEALPRQSAYEVWPEHADALTTFLRCVTQWRSVGERVVGLDYAVVLDLMRIYPLSRDLPEVLEDVQVIEQKAVELLNQKANAT